MSRSSGTTPEYAMHCEPVSPQNLYRLRLAELLLKAGKIRWLKAAEFADVLLLCSVE